MNNNETDDKSFVYESGLTEDELFYLMNNDQVIEEDEEEDLIWSKYL